MSSAFPLFFLQRPNTEGWSSIPYCEISQLPAVEIAIAIPHYPIWMKTPTIISVENRYLQKKPVAFTSRIGPFPMIYDQLYTQSVHIFWQKLPPILTTTSPFWVKSPLGFPDHQPAEEPKSHQSSLEVLRFFVEFQKWLPVSPFCCGKNISKKLVVSTPFGKYLSNWIII